ncbi:MAG: MATE family efflux transporter, partial [Chitinispirillaceae bacterium]
TAFHSQGLHSATAVTIAFNWDMVSFIPLSGFGIAVTSLVGRYIGARDLHTAHLSTFSALKISLFYAALLLIPFGIFTDAMVDLFLPAEASIQYQQTRDLAMYMVRFIAFYILGDAVLVVFSGALRGAGDTFWTMMIYTPHPNLPLGKGKALTRWFYSSTLLRGRLGGGTFVPVGADVKLSATLLLPGLRPTKKMHVVWL